MVYNGHIENGVVVLEDSPSLPEGTRVEVHVPGISHEDLSIGKALLQFSGVLKDLPPDLAENHDHYLHGLAY